MVLIQYNYKYVHTSKVFSRLRTQRQYVCLKFAQCRSLMLYIFLIYYCAIILKWLMKVTEYIYIYFLKVASYADTFYERCSTQLNLSMMLYLCDTTSCITDPHKMSPLFLHTATPSPLIINR